MSQTRHSREGGTSYLIVGTCVIIAILIVGAAAWKPVSNKVRLSEYRSETLAQVGDSPSGAGCQPAFKLAVTGNASEVAEGDGAYLTAPPAYGPYSAASAASTAGAQFYDATDRPALTDLVADEYAGYTILWYDSSITGSKLAQIQAIVDKMNDATDDRDLLIAAPWTSTDRAVVTDAARAQFPSGTHIAFTHWSTGGAGKSDPAGVFQYCSGVSGAALKQFMVMFPYTDSPSPGTLPTQQATS